MVPGRIAVRLSGTLTVDLHLALHAIVDRREFDVFTQTLVALQQQPQLDILDSVWTVATPRTGGFQDFPATHAGLALMVLARAVQGAEGFAQEVPTDGAGQ